MTDKFLTWLYVLLLTFLAHFTNNADAVFYALFLSLGLIITDFITGCAASLYEGRRIVSKRLRWSFAKFAVYAVSIVGTLFTGILLHLIECIINPDQTQTGILIFTIFCIKIEAYVISWIETVSIVENMRRIFTKNLFLKYVHWILSVEIVKKIPKLSEFLKEKTEKTIDEKEGKDNG